jgi:hypothetical protein
LNAEPDIPPPGERDRPRLTEPARDAGRLSPEADRPELRDALELLLGFAASLQELPLDCVEPAFAPPRWE